MNPFNMGSLLIFEAQKSEIYLQGQKGHDQISCGQSMNFQLKSCKRGAEKWCLS